MTGVLVACLLGLLAGPAAAEAAGPSSYVALGDSYTSGPGIPGQIPESGGCGRSDHNYPHLVAAALEIDRFTDVSCGSATTDHMAQAQPLPGGLTNGPQLDALSASNCGPLVRPPGSGWAWVMWSVVALPQLTSVNRSISRAAATRWG